MEQLAIGLSVYIFVVGAAWFYGAHKGRQQKQCRDKRLQEVRELIERNGKNLRDINAILGSAK